jgi:hypothetical protein
MRGRDDMRIIWPIFVITYIIGSANLVVFIIEAYQNRLVEATFPMIFIAPVILLFFIRELVRKIYLKATRLPNEHP